MSGESGGEPLRADPEALLAMQTSPYTYSDTKWLAYQNQELGHRDLGHLKFLACGPQNTMKTPTKRLPDTPGSINWRYQLVGVVNLKTGTIEKE